MAYGVSRAGLDKAVRGLIRPVHTDRGVQCVFSRLRRGYHKALPKDTDSKGNNGLERGCIQTYMYRYTHTYIYIHSIDTSSDSTHKSLRFYLHVVHYHIEVYKYISVVFG